MTINLKENVKFSSSIALTASQVLSGRHIGSTDRGHSHHSRGSVGQHPAGDTVWPLPSVPGFLDLNHQHPPPLPPRLPFSWQGGGSETLAIHPRAYPLWGPWGAQHSFGAQLAAGLGMCHLYFTAFSAAFSLQDLRLPDPMWGEEVERIALFYEYRAPILPI